MYSDRARVEVRDSLVHGFAADASSGATTIMYVVGAAAAVLDRVTWSNNDLDAVASIDGAVIVVRNNEGLAVADTQGAELVSCSFEEIIDYCSLEAECTDVITGISCYCYADGVQTDPNLGACSSSGEMSSLVLGSEKTQLLLLSKDDGNATTSLFFPNTGDVFIVWGLAVTKNPEGLNWTTFLTNGTLEAGEMQEIALSLDMSGIQARSAEYSTELTLNVSSPTPTPFPISSITTVVVRTIVTALASAAASFVVISDPARLAAGDLVTFTVTPVDGTGRVILDPTDFAYFGTLKHSISNTGVSCRVGYDLASNLQKGTCNIPRTVCSFDDAGSDQCAMSPPVGEFTLKVNDLKGIAVGKTLYSFTVASCPAAYYQRDGKCAQCPPHVTCGADSLISDWQLDEGYWRAGDEHTEILACRFGARSCPGTSLNQATGREQYCGPGFVGPLCSQCAADYFLSWAGEGDCHRCTASKSHLPTIGLAFCVLILCAVFARKLYKCRKRPTDASFAETNAPPTMFARLESLFLLAKVKIFTLLLVSQATR